RRPALNRCIVLSDLRFGDLPIQGSNAANRFACYAVAWQRRVIRTASIVFTAIFAAGLQAADNVSVLGNRPRWDVLEHYQQTITRDEFTHLINDVYGTHGFASDLIEIMDEETRILMNREGQEFFTFRLATGDS